MFFALFERIGQGKSLQGNDNCNVLSLKSSPTSPMVELRGIEPLSENNLTRLSPGGVCYLHSLTAA